MNKTKQIIKEALELPSLDRAEIADQLLQSLNEPSEDIDRLWKIEAEDRITKYDQGKIESFSVDEVLAKYSDR